jgi:phosphoribosyl 1,2-cyclic phosphate phosphodiesterase
LLIDTPAEIGDQLNRAQIHRIDYLLFTHLDPDHVEGFRVVEKVALDFRTWEAYPGKHIQLILPQHLNDRVGDIRSTYGSLVDYYVTQGFLQRRPFHRKIIVNGLRLTALEVKRDSQFSFIYVFEKGDKKLVYAACDIRPFPTESVEVRNPDLLVIQPGLFESGLRHGFRYPRHHVSRKTLYTFEETLALAERIGARQVLFVHLEEYWNRSHDDYLAIEDRFPNIRFAYDGMQIAI